MRTLLTFKPCLGYSSETVLCRNLLVVRDIHWGVGVQNPLGPCKQAIIFQYWTLTWSLTYTYLFCVLCHVQHCTGHVPTGSFVGRGNQYILLVKVLYCKLLTIGKQLPTFLHKVRGLYHRPQRWEVSVLPLDHRGPANINYMVRSKFEMFPS